MLSTVEIQPMFNIPLLIMWLAKRNVCPDRSDSSSIATVEDHHSPFTRDSAREITLPVLVLSHFLSQWSPLPVLYDVVVPLNSHQYILVMSQ
jgi:hypothetical protein